MGLRSSLNGFLRSPLALTFTPESALPEENKENWLSSERDRLKANGEDVKRQRAGGGEAHSAFVETERRRWRCFLEFFSSKLTVSGSSGRAGVHPLWKDGAAWLQAFTHRQCLLALFCQQSVCSPSRLPPRLPPATADGHPALTLCRWRQGEAGWRASSYLELILRQWVMDHYTKLPPKRDVHF